MEMSEPQSVHCTLQHINPSPNDKTISWSKIKAFADDKIKIAKMFIFIFDMVENIVEKGENAGCQHFLVFLQCFQKIFYLRVVKYRDCVGKS